MKLSLEFYFYYYSNKFQLTNEKKSYFFYVTTVTQKKNVLCFCNFLIFLNIWFMLIIPDQYW